MPATMERVWKAIDEVKSAGCGCDKVREVRL
jgi:hypothetical protein